MSLLIQMNKFQVNLFQLPYDMNKLEYNHFHEILYNSFQNFLMNLIFHDIHLLMNVFQLMESMLIINYNLKVDQHLQLVEEDLH